ncbi:MAG TPA: glycosyltransferase family 2 protein [Terriglobia bacterium]|nr:glycosyltransferase family 2 protein [Terriglobia bacterium]
MPQLSVFVITKNESADIAGCLESVTGLADEMVVVDSHSEDDTAEICRRMGARVIVHDFAGYGAQKQFALDQTGGDWALSIDADERVTPALADEIRAVIRDDRPEAGFEVRRNFYFLRRHLRFGGQGNDWVLRLFRRERGTLRSLRVHERIEVQGAVGRLKHPLEHLSFPTLDEYLEKCNRYSTLAAEEQFARGRRFSPLDHLRPAWELLVRVGIKGAWLDGHAGLTYAALSAHAAWLRAIKLREIERSREEVGR